MESKLQQIDEGVYTVGNLFSKVECLNLISRAESIGFVAATVQTANEPKMMTHVRNNDRVSLKDPELTGTMWQRIKNIAPPLDSCLPCGADADLKFYRYSPGQQFKLHKDGVATSEDAQTSKLSYLIYLNDDCQGGATRFRESRDTNGTLIHPEIIVSPAVGTALLFRHERWHEGASVTSGFKYVLRSNVFYTSIGGG